MSTRGHRDVAIGELLGQADPGTVRRYSHAYQTEGRAIADDVSDFLAGDTKATGEPS